MLFARFPLVAALTFCATAAFNLCQSSDAHAQEAAKKKVGITVAAVINGPAELGITVSDVLGQSLLERFDIEVLAGADAQAKLPAIARSEQCLGDSACLVEAGKALEVDELLMLIIVDVGDQVKVEATWVEVSSGKTALRTAIDAHQAKELMAKDFVGQAKLILPEAPEKLDPNATDLDPIDQRIEDNKQGELVGSTTTTTSTTGGRRMSPLAKGLMFGGMAALGVSVGYFGYHLIECGGTECSEDKARPGLDKTTDIIGGLGLVSISVASFLYFTSEEEEKQLPVSLDLRENQFGVTFGGRF